MKNKVRQFLKPDIRVIMYSQDIKVGDAARACGVDIAFLSRALRGKQPASRKIIGGLAKRLGLPEAYLSVPSVGLPKASGEQP